MTTSQEPTKSSLDRPTTVEELMRSDAFLTRQEAERRMARTLTPADDAPHVHDYPMEEDSNYRPAEPKREVRKHNQMTPAQHLLLPILESVLEQMLRDGTSPAYIVNAVLEVSLAHCESNLSSLTRTTIERSDELIVESNRWAERSFVSNPDEDETTHRQSLERHDQEIEDVYVDQKEIQARATEFTAMEMEALRLLDDVGNSAQCAAEITQAMKDRIVQRCRDSHDDFSEEPSPDRHAHVLRSLVDRSCSALSAKAKMPEPVESAISRRTMSDRNPSSGFDIDDDEVPF